MIIFCHTNFLNRQENRFFHVKWLHFVRDSVYAFAHALHDMWNRKCTNKGICEAMGTHDEGGHHGHIHGEDLYEYLRNVSFKGRNIEKFVA